MLRSIADVLFKKRWHILIAGGLAALAAAVGITLSQHGDTATAQSPSDPGAIFGFFRDEPRNAEAPSFREGKNAGTEIHAAIDQPDRKVFGVAKADGDFCLVVEQGWASRGCAPIKELANGAHLMSSLDYTGHDQVQVTALIPDKVSGANAEWRSGTRVAYTAKNNVLQATASRSELPVTLHWKDPAGIPHQQSLSG
ncbi:MAG: hypothetical protein QOH11_833 [Solirubrobacteraceae bacterium]|jgi:hypothetical protein|nr:hypothetical protein [Solirubrobacteraceae bacterium]